LPVHDGNGGRKEGHEPSAAVLFRQHPRVDDVHPAPSADDLGDGTQVRAQCRPQQIDLCDTTQTDRGPDVSIRT